MATSTRSTPAHDSYGHDTPTSGDELWAFIPKEMLPHLKDLYTDLPVGTKHYGLDGSIAVLKYDINGDGAITGSDRVILYFGTGRNVGHVGLLRARCHRPQ